MCFSRFEAREDLLFAPSSQQVWNVSGKVSNVISAQGKGHVAKFGPRLEEPDLYLLSIM